MNVTMTNLHYKTCGLKAAAAVETQKYYSLLSFMFI